MDDSHALIPFTNRIVPNENLIIQTRKRSTLSQSRASSQGRSLFFCFPHRDDGERVSFLDSFDRKYIIAVCIAVNQRLKLRLGSTSWPSYGVSGCLKACGTEFLARNFNAEIAAGARQTTSQSARSA